MTEQSKTDWRAIAAETAQATRERHEEAQRIVANESVIKWQKCERGILRRVDFAMGTAVVELVECFDYVSGRVYRVRDVKTGHEDLVGVEFLKAV